VKKFIALLFVAVLAACATPPQSLDESLAAAEEQISSLEQSAATALSAGAITEEVAQKVLSLGDEAIAGIHAARVAENNGSTDTVRMQLDVVNAILAQLISYLTAHGVK